MIIGALDIKNNEAKHPQIYMGLKAVASACKKYQNEFEREFNSTEFIKHNFFLILFDILSENVFAIWDFGMFCPAPVDFLFCTQFVPVRTMQYNDEYTLQKSIKQIKKELQFEINIVKSNKTKPIIPVGYEGENDYIGWSMSEGKYIKIYNYKSYRGFFCIGDLSSDELKIIVKDDEYSVTPLSDNLIRDLGLDLYSEIWKYRTKGDIWEKRPEWKKYDNIPPDTRDLYDRAVDYINRGRTFAFGSAECFVDLERRVHNLERLLDLNISLNCEIAEKNKKLIMASLDECIEISTNSALKRILCAIFGARNDT